MTTSPISSCYAFWGTDNVAHGPVDLPRLVEWIAERRVTSETWVFSYNAGSWARASQVAELQAAFSALAHQQGNQTDTATFFSPAVPAMRPSNLRRIKMLATMTDQEIAHFAQATELVTATPFQLIVKQDSPGDAMFLMLEGEARVRLSVGGHEKQLAVLAAGDFFGETCLFDQGTRSADVIATQDCLLLKVTAARFQKLIANHPDIAAPILFALGRTLVARIRADNRRVRDFLTMQAALSD